MSKKRPEMPELTPAQGEIMEIIWELGEVSATGVRRVLARTRPVARNTVPHADRTNGRERLGLRIARTAGPSSTRRPGPGTPQSGRKVREIIETVCGGSPEALVTALLDYRGLQPRRAGEDPQDARQG